MYELTVDAEFCAAHAIIIAGVREPNHGHNWRVTVTVCGPQLDADGLLCDFHDVERALKSVIAPFHNNDLNALPEFQAMNASAELVAREIWSGVNARMAGKLARGAWIGAVRVTESVGCAATYRAGAPA